MNAMLYVRGRPLDYDGWEAQGAPGWGYADVLPYFKRSEDNVRGASAYHGAGGPLHVAEQRSPRPMSARLLAASEAAGIPRIADYNGPEQDGASMFQVTQKNGRRFSAADAYLRPALTRPNLEVRKNVSVLAVELEGDRAVGVRVGRGRRGSVEILRAEREVLLSAGAIGSPQLLQLSGIGGGEDLRAAGVEVRHELPGVGRNLQDHPFVTVIWEVSDTNTLYGADKPKPLAEWLLRRTGKLSSTVAEVVAFTRTRGGLPARRHPVPHGRRLLRRPRRRDLRGRLHGDRPHARLADRPAGACGCARRTRPPSRASSPTRCPSPTTCVRCSRACGWRVRSPRSRRCAS